jgi:CBS domain-containing protein
MNQVKVARRTTVRLAEGRVPDRETLGITDLRDAPVTALMGAPAITVWLGSSLDVALRSFAVHGVRHLVVVDGVGRAVGVLTDRLVTACWALRPMTFESMRVADVYAGLPPFVSPGASVADVARVMHRCGTDAVVVVDDAVRPVGVVTTSDLITILAKPRPA